MHTDFSLPRGSAFSLDHREGFNSFQLQKIPIILIIKENAQEIGSQSKAVLLELVFWSQYPF